MITTFAFAKALAKFALPACVAARAQVPPPTIVSWLPATVQILAALLVLNVNAVRPLLDVAVRVIDDAPKVTGEEGANVTVWPAPSIVNEYVLAPLNVLASVAVKVKLNIPRALAVPLSTPPVESDSPPGNTPEVTAKLYAAVPPLALMVWL